MQSHVGWVEPTITATAFLFAPRGPSKPALFDSPKAKPNTFWQPTAIQPGAPVAAVCWVTLYSFRLPSIAGCPNLRWTLDSLALYPLNPTYDKSRVGCWSYHLFPLLSNPMDFQFLIPTNLENTTRQIRMLAANRPSL